MNYSLGKIESDGWVGEINVIEHGFKEKFLFSEGVEINKNILKHLMDSVPGSNNIIRASKAEDLNGTDYWILRGNGLTPISVDLKNRSFCPIEKFGKDDACIETTSVYKGPYDNNWQDSFRIKPGWTIDPNKRTDLVVYTYPHASGGRRFWILYYPHLCKTAMENWRGWAADYGERATRNKGYLTLNVYVPRTVIAGEMRKLVYGIA